MGAQTFRELIFVWKEVVFLVLMGYNVQKRSFDGSFLQICKEFPTQTLAFTIKLTGLRKTGQPLNIELSEVSIAFNDGCQ